MKKEIVKQNQGQVMFYSIFAIFSLLLALFAIFIPVENPESGYNFAKALFGSCFIIMFAIFTLKMLEARKVAHQMP